ncbi:hypothetical protein EYF80_064125 [Liparis tanakae]|uniref:Uncharacterized protein n=1 Tax=Liparis tanakae TaxID=230148 RepID=A0A4Z2EAK4_9TELE|nr:hypothetical protein EYF80_064125 [Liparis tanakae]
MINHYFELSRCASLLRAGRSGLPYLSAKDAVKDTQAEREGPEAQAGPKVPAAEPRCALLPGGELLPAAGRLLRGRARGSVRCLLLRHFSAPGGAESLPLKMWSHRDLHSGNV